MEMNATVEQIVQAALALPEEERLELIEVLLDSQDRTNDLPFDPAWLPELQRRSGEIEAGAVSTAPWSVVRERVRRRVEERARG